MQRFGPPPAYPNLKIPGVNAPIPDSMHYGEGKYITDERGFTVYADCHGLNKVTPSDGSQAFNIYEQRKEQRVYWGQLKEESEAEEADESGEVEEMDQEDLSGQSVGEYNSEDDDDLPPGMKSGITSIIKDVQIGGVDIRKKELQKKADDLLQKDSAEFEQPKEEGVKMLYKVLKEVDAGVTEGQIMGTGHTYEYQEEKKAEPVPVPEKEVKESEPKKPKKEKKEKIKYKF